MSALTPARRLCRAASWLAAIVALVLATGCAPSEVTTLQGRTMGTTWTVKLVLPAGTAAKDIRRGVQGEVDRVVAQMSTYEPGSDLSRFNRAAPGSWNTVPTEFFGVLEYALGLARDTGGAYDPTVGPLVNLWGFGPGAKQHLVPSDADIAAARERVGWNKLKLDPANHRVWQPGGVYVDLSSIAKGFGTDQIARWLDRAGVADYLVDISGELRARGARPGGRGWQVAVEKPGAAAAAAETADEMERVIALENMSIATSGDYRHFFEDGEHVYSHHIDPRTARPVEHRIASVTTIAGDCMQADANGTAMMVLGPEAGMAYAEQHHLAVLFLLHDGQTFHERQSSAFAALVETR